MVREAVDVSTGRSYAVKTIGKIPKRGMPTPRYLLKLRTEVEIMQQLGYSLDAVHLKVMVTKLQCNQQPSSLINWQSLPQHSDREDVWQDPQ